jgi:hypothetical protein
MTVAHHLPHARFAAKPLSLSFATKVLQSWGNVFSRLHAPSGDLLVNVAFGAVAVYGATMVVSLLTL